MAKATRVLSTPRRTASKIKPAKLSSDGERARAYSELETPIREVFNMSELAFDATMAAGSGKEREERMLFAVFQLCDMVRDLHNMYHGRPITGRWAA
jgi:hypothetical protein